MSYPAQQGPPTVIYVTTPPVPAPPVPAPPVPAPPIQANSEWRNKPQTHATLAGGFIFISGGLNMALSTGLSGTLKHFCYSWFIGVIIGAILSIPLRHFISKKFIMAASSLLILVGGILFISNSYNYNVLLAGRYINGIAIGLSIVPFLMNASEIADDSYRGSCLAIEQYSMSFGIAIRMLYTSYWSANVNFPANRLHGILDICLAVVAAGCLALFVESPIEQIRKGNEAAALESLGRLRRPQGVTTETTALLEQQKDYIREEERLTVGQSLGRGFLPLLKMIVVRSMMLAFCFSMPLNMAFQFSMIRIGRQLWAPALSAGLRMFGSLTAIVLVQRCGRKLPTVLPVALIASCFIGLGSIFRYLTNILNYQNMNGAMGLYMVTHFFAGLYAPYTSVYMGEAFPLRVKPYLMDVVVIVEQLLQIIFIAIFRLKIGNTLMTQGIIMLVTFVLMCLTLPETRNTSLAEAQSRFRKLLNFGSN